MLRRAPAEFRYTQTESSVGLFQQLGASLLMSTYQANKLLVVRGSGSGLSTLVHTFDRPMGLAVDSRRLAIGTRKEIWFYGMHPISLKVSKVERPLTGGHEIDQCLDQGRAAGLNAVAIDAIEQTEANLRDILAEIGS